MHDADVGISRRAVGWNVTNRVTKTSWLECDKQSKTNSEHTVIVIANVFGDLTGNGKTVSL